MQQSLLPPLLSQVTVGGPSWPALGRLDPYGTGGGGGGEGTWLILKSIAFLFSFFFQSVSLVEY